MKKTWVCGRSEDNWDGCDEFDTKEAAIKWGRSEYESYDIDGFVVGIKKPHELDKNIVDVDHVLEQVNNTVCDDMGENAEYAENYLLGLEGEQREELGKELNKTFHKWIEKYNLKPNFFEVVKIEEVEMFSD